jgi:hypothetical protein
MHNSLKIIKTLLYSYSAVHVSGTLVPSIRSLLILHIQPPVTVCRWVGCIFQLWSIYGGGEIFLTCPDRPWGPPSLLYNGYRVFPGSKERPRRDADPSLPSSAVVMNE